jgi:sporulation protein YlmC with PRC-barrel domain
MPQRPRLIANPTRPLRSARRQRRSRLLAVRSVRDSLLSLAGLVGSPVRNQDGDHIGRVTDVVARWGGEEPYPAVTGLVVKIGGRRAFASMDQVASVGRDGVTLGSARFDLMEFARRDGEVLLGQDVLDHQSTSMASKSSDRPIFIWP